MIQNWKNTILVPYSPQLRCLLQRLMEEDRSFSFANPDPWSVVRGPLGSDAGGMMHLWIGKLAKSARPRCGARTRRGTPCQARAVEGKERCRLHGGLSTGPKSQEGRARIAESNRRRAIEKRLVEEGKQQPSHAGEHPVFVR